MSEVVSAPADPEGPAPAVADRSEATLSATLAVAGCKAKASERSDPRPLACPEDQMEEPIE